MAITAGALAPKFFPAAVIKGPGSVEIGPVSAAGGETILTGANIYTGGTFIQDTTILQLGNGGTTGSILGDVTFRPLGINGPDPGMLIFNRSNTYQFDGAISGRRETGHARSRTGTTIVHRQQRPSTRAKTTVNVEHARSRTARSRRPR